MEAPTEAGKKSFDEEELSWTRKRVTSNLRPLKQSKFTRIVYVGIIFVVISAGMLMITPQITGRLQRVFCRPVNYYFCDLLLGYDAVYRLGFALAVWFIILAVATLGVMSSNEKRAKIQNNCWPTKLVCLILLEILFLFIPHSEYNGEVWMFFGLNGAFCYVILQYTFILDAANCFNVFSKSIFRNEKEDWTSRAVFWFHHAKTFTTTFLFSVSLLSSITFYFMYAAHFECMDNFVFLLFHLIMCFSASVISSIPVVGEVSPQTGPFQCSVTSLYCTYLIWLAFSSEPDSRCNPSNMHRFPGPPMTNVQVFVTLIISFGTLVLISIRDLVAPQYGKVCTPKISPENAQSPSKSDITCQNIVEQSYLVSKSPFSPPPSIHEDVLSSCSEEREKDAFTGNSPLASFSEISLHNSRNTCGPRRINCGDTKRRCLDDVCFVWDDERGGTEYSYSFLHLTFCLATIFLLMSITNWYRLDEGEHLTTRLVQSWSAVWLRVSASIFCWFILIWSMVVPLVFPDSYRDLLFFQYMTSLPKS